MHGPLAAKPRSRALFSVERSTSTYTVDAEVERRCAENEDECVVCFSAYEDKLQVTSYKLQVTSYK